MHLLYMCGLIMARLELAARSHSLVWYGCRLGTLGLLPVGDLSSRTACASLHGGFWGSTRVPGTPTCPVLWVKKVTKPTQVQGERKWTPPTHGSILAWRIPWTEEPGGLQSLGPQRVRHDWVTNAFTFADGRSSRVMLKKHAVERGYCVCPWQ